MRTLLLLSGCRTEPVKDTSNFHFYRVDQSIPVPFPLHLPRHLRSERRTRTFLHAGGAERKVGFQWGPNTLPCPHQPSPAAAATGWVHWGGRREVGWDSQFSRLFVCTLRTERTRCLGMIRLVWQRREYVREYAPHPATHPPHSPHPIHTQSLTVSAGVQPPVDVLLMASR